MNGIVFIIITWKSDDKFINHQFILPIIIIIFFLFMSLLKLKIDIPYSLFLSRKVKPSLKRGRHSKTPSPSNKKRLFSQRPVNDVRYNQLVEAVK